MSNQNKNQNHIQQTEWRERDKGNFQQQTKRKETNRKKKIELFDPKKKINNHYQCRLNFNNIIKSNHK